MIADKLRAIFGRKKKRSNGYSMTIWPVDDPDFEFSEQAIAQAEEDGPTIYYDPERQHFDVETTVEFMDEATQWANECIARFIDGKGYDFFLMGGSARPMAMYGYHLMPVSAAFSLLITGNGG